MNIQLKIITQFNKLKKDLDYFTKEYVYYQTLYLDKIENKKTLDLLKEYRRDDKNSKYTLSETEGIDGLIKTKFNHKRYEQYKKK